MPLSISKHVHQLSEHTRVSCPLLSVFFALTWIFAYIWFLPSKNFSLETLPSHGFVGSWLLRTFDLCILHDWRYPQHALADLSARGWGCQLLRSSGTRSDVMSDSDDPWDGWHWFWLSIPEPGQDGRGVASLSGDTIIIFFYSNKQSGTVAHACYLGMWMETQEMEHGG